MSFRDATSRRRIAARLLAVSFSLLAGDAHGAGSVVISSGANNGNLSGGTITDGSINSALASSPVIISTANGVSASQTLTTNSNSAISWNAVTSLTLTGNLSETLNGSIASSNAAGNLGLKSPTTTISSIATISVNGSLNLSDATGGSSGAATFQNGANVFAGSLSSLGTTSLGVGTVSTNGSQTYGKGVSLTGSNLTLNSVSSGTIIFDSTVDGAENLRTNTAGATIFDGAVGGVTALTSLNTDAGGSTAVNGGSVRTSGVQTYNDPVTIGAGANFSSTGGGNIVFASMVEGGFAAVISTGGVTTFNGAVGNVAPLTSLTTAASGSTTINGGAVQTTGAQSYGDPLSIGANTTFASSGSGNLTFSSTLNGAFAVTFNAGGVTTFNGAVGGTAPLTSLTTGASGTTLINTASVRTTGTQTYNNPVLLAANTVISSIGGGAITFATTLDGASAVTINSSGVTTFNGAVGGATALTSLVTDAAGETLVNGGLVRTSGLQTYNDAVTIGADAAFTSSGAGSITFGSTLDGAFNATVNTGGVTTFAGAVGAITPLNSVTTDSAGSTVVNGGLVTTNGDQAFNDPVTIGSDTTFTSVGGGASAFANTLDGAFAVNTATSGVTTFNNAVGAGTPLASLATGADGSTAINGVSVTTSGFQDYGNPVLLGGGATAIASIGGGAITFETTLDGASMATINTTGVTTFNGDVGDVTPLVQLSVTNAAGSTEIVGNVTTTAGQTYDNPLTLAGGAAASQNLTDVGAGSIVFNSTVTSSASQLNVTADGGMVTFKSVVNLPNTMLFVDGAAGIDLADAGTVTALSLQTSGGSTTLPAALTTSLDQTYYSPVTLTAATETLISNSGAVMFNASIFGPTTALVVNGNTGNSFNGGSVFLASLDAQSTGGSLTTLGANINTSGSQTFETDVALSAAAASVSLSAGGSIVFDRAITGQLTALSVDGAVSNTFNGAVKVSSLTVNNNPGTTFLNADVTTTNGELFSNTSVALSGAVRDLTDFGSSSAIIFDAGVSVTGLTTALVVDAQGSGGNQFNGYSSNAYPGVVLVQSLLAEGSTTNLGKDIVTTNGQTYSGKVTLSGAVRQLTDSGAAITFNAGTTIAGTSTQLFVDGAGGNSFGGSVTVKSLDAVTATTLSGSATTTLGQDYESTLVLGGSGGQTLSDTGIGSILFSGAVSGGVPSVAALNVAASNGSVIFGSTVVLPNTAITVSSGSATTFEGTVTAQSLLSLGGFGTKIGSNLTTTGAQTYANPVTINAPSAERLSGSLVSFQSSLAGDGNSLTITGNASFDGTVSNLASLAVTGNETVGNVASGIIDQMSGAYSVGGALDLAVGAGSSGKYTISGGSLSVGGAIAVFGGGQLNINGGNTTAGVLNLTGPYTQTAGAASFGQITGNGPITITGGTTTLNAGGGVSQISSLSLSGAGTLDITKTNSLVVNYGLSPDPVATIRGYLKSAYHGGIWNGTGLTSSSVKAQVAGAIANGGGVWSIGYADGSQDITQTIAVGNQLVIRPALAGDANMDGSVTFIDLGIVAQNLGATNSDWEHGDFNYDGTTNFLDIGLLAQNLSRTMLNTPLSEVVPDASAVFKAQWNLAVAEVEGNSVFQPTNLPEPRMVGMLAAMSACLLARRGRIFYAKR
jgi:hypothetical protein